MKSDQPHPGKMRADASAGTVRGPKPPAAEIKLPPGSETAAVKNADATTAKIGGPAPANSLTPEEQMARFAKELQENDWGHQPC